MYRAANLDLGINAAQDPNGWFGGATAQHQGVSRAAAKGRSRHLAGTGGKLTFAAPTRSVCFLESSLNV